MQKIVVLMGPKHCGKSAVAFALKSKLNWRSGDLDLIIEKRTGKTPRELYLEGPEVFRSAEANILSFILHKEDVKQNETGLIIAAGGGIIDNRSALEKLLFRPEVIIVYLEASAETAWRRINESAQKDGSLPPFLQKENPEAAHREVHERRAANYKKIAHIIINVENKSTDLIAKEIEEELMKDTKAVPFGLRNEYDSQEIL